MSNTVTVDDNDPRITYDGFWILGGNASSVEYAGTTHETLTAGAAATFTFSGTSVAVFGTITSLSVSPLNPASTYTIDGSEIATFAPTEDNSIHYRQQFFSSPSLASGSHTLVITCNVNNGYLFLDYIQFTPSSNTSSTTQTSTKTTTTPVNQGQTSASASQSTASVTLGSLVGDTTTIQGSDTLISSTTSHSSSSSVSALSAASSRSDKIPVGAIVGGVIAAAALVVITAIALCLIRRSRRTRQRLQNSVTPFPNTAQGSGGDDDDALREGTNDGLRNTVLFRANTRNRKTLTNLHSPGSSSIPPGLQYILTTGTPQDQEVACRTDVEPPPEYHY